MGERLLSRREFVKGAMVLGAGAALGAGALSSFLPALSGGPTAAPQPIIRRVGMEKVPIRLAELDGPAVAHVLGEWQLRPAIVLKVHVATLRASSAARGYNTGQFALQHPAEPDMAVLAYDAKCTHLGCPVGYNAGLGDSKDIPDYAAEGVQGRMICPCHQSQFDVFDLGKNLPAAPAQRPLDAIAIRWGDAVDGSPTIEGTRRFYQASSRAADQQGAGAAFKLAG